MSSNCCSPKRNRISNQIIFWINVSCRSSCSAPKRMQCTMTSYRELLLIKTNKIPNWISLDQFCSSCSTPNRMYALQEQVRINLGSTNTPPSPQRAAHSEHEELIERQWHLQCLLCSALKPLPEQDERNQKRGNVEVENCDHYQRV